MHCSTGLAVNGINLKTSGQIPNSTQILLGHRNSCLIHTSSICPIITFGFLSYSMTDNALSSLELHAV